jgi:hypothetical protein
VSAERLGDFVSNMTGAQSDMVGVADAEIDVADIQIPRDQDAKMVILHVTTRRIAGVNLDEAQTHLTGSEIIRRRRKVFIHTGSSHFEFPVRYHPSADPHAASL